MLHLLRRHPFAVEAYFEYSAVLTYAFPSEILRPLLASGLTLDEKDGLGFVAVAMVQTRSLRPQGFPAFLGQDFFLTGYRIFARFTSGSGKKLRGLRILRSETNRRRMVFAGNLLTHYNYHYLPIRAKHSGSLLQVNAPGISAEFRKADSVSLPPGSVFKDWREARMFAGPLPFTFDYEQETHSIIVIEGVRENWDPEPVLAEASCDFLKSPEFRGVQGIFSSAFLIENIPYMWKKGRREKVA